MKLVEIGRDAASYRFGDMQNFQAAGQRSILPCLAGARFADTRLAPPSSNNWAASWCRAPDAAWRSRIARTSSMAAADLAQEYVMSRFRCFSCSAGEIRPRSILSCIRADSSSGVERVEIGGGVGAGLANRIGGTSRSPGRRSTSPPGEGCRSPRRDLEIRKPQPGQNSAAISSSLRRPAMTMPAFDAVGCAAKDLAVVAADHDQRKIGAAEPLGRANGGVDILVLRHRTDKEEEAGEAQDAACR